MRILILSPISTPKTKLIVMANASHFLFNISLFNVATFNKMSWVSFLVNKSKFIFGENPCTLQRG